MATNALLGDYLGDHLAGSAAGRDLARKLADDNQGTALGAFMEELCAEIEADRETLEEVMDRLELERQSWKQAGTWMAEKLSRVRFSRALTRSAQLSQLFELETLSMGIHGKVSLWEALRHVAGTDARLVGIDLDALAKRAQRQLERLELRRLAAAVEAFAA
jgi:hypothetical protein